MIKDKDYWRNKKREQRAKIKMAQESLAVEEPVKDSAWDEEEFPDREVWDMAVGRAWRAREYARKQPDKIGGGDERFQDIGWQYKQVKGRKAEGFVPEWVSDDPHPVFPWLRKVPGREYDGNGLVLKKQRCEGCGGTWSASKAIECPYCAGKGKKAA